MICKRPSCSNPARENLYRGKTPEYCSKKCKNIEGVNALRKRRKKIAVDYKGGSCIHCGYNRSLGSLHFHHKDDNKEFGINRGYTMTMERMKSELDKCDLVCANCHGELHWGVDV